jgi:hypothetical protein
MNGLGKKSRVRSWVMSDRRKRQSEKRILFICNEPIFVETELKLRGTEKIMENNFQSL